LGIGDAAPPLAVAKWVTGSPLTAIEPGQVHVVEFWATWCGPCLASMPHISELQKEYGDKVHFIGVTRENEDVVQKFLDRERKAGETWRETISYRLALDEDSAMNTNYMRAAGQNGIPCAFIVGRDGAVEWIGHPMRIDAPLAKVVSGEWDRGAAIAEQQEQVRQRELQSRLGRVLRAEKPEEALALLDEMTAGTEPSPAMTQMRWMILKRAGRTDEAAKVQGQLVEQVWDSPDMLNQIAWSIAIDTSEQRDLNLAVKAAQRASELREHKDAAILDTLARAHYEQGNLDKAIEWQRKAVAQAEERDEIVATLKRYEDEKTAAAAPPAGESGNP
jgi:thiol-disulfide isomerase/thioredoxin